MEEEKIEFLAQGAADDKDKEGKGGAAAGKAVEPAMRVTSRYMTKYERARILGTRALQLR